MSPEKTARLDKKLVILVEASVMIALALVLSYVRIFKMPQGGSITAVSMLPILVIGYRHGVKWGIGSAAVYSLLQLLQDGGIVPPTSTFVNYMLVFILDYFVAFSVLGLSGIFKKNKFGLIISVPFCCTLRFLFHFIGGIIVWSVYAPDNQSAALYSFLYNGSYMGVETVLTAVVAGPLNAALYFINKKV